MPICKLGVRFFVCNTCDHSNCEICKLQVSFGSTNMVTKKLTACSLQIVLWRDTQQSYVLGRKLALSSILIVSIVVELL
jgi:hypothetical protein